MLLCVVVFELVGIMFVLIYIILCCIVSVMKYWIVENLLLFIVVEFVKFVVILFFYFCVNYGFEVVLVNCLNCVDGLFM